MGIDPGGEERPRAPTLPRPAWRTRADAWVETRARDPFAYGPATLERLRPLDSAGDRHSDAEYAFYRLHGRFQRYAEACLDADERLLAFVPWTADAAGPWRARLGRRLAPGGRQAAAGALVVTDRQVLLLRDAAEPAAGAVYWGFAARATVVDRLAGVTVAAEAGGPLRLTLRLRAAGGGETVAWDFPSAMRGELREAAARLAAFVPRAGDRRLRPPGRLLPSPGAPVTPAARWGRRLRAMGPAVSPAVGAALDEALRATLTDHAAPGGAPRLVLARAIGVGDEGAVPCLLAVTQTHLFAVPPPGHGAPDVYPLAALTTIELRRSALGNAVAWTIGGADGHSPRRREAAFPPVAAADCLALFLMLRQALGLLPAQAAGPDLAEESPAREDAGARPARARDSACDGADGG